MSFPKYWGIRHPLRPDYYLDTDLPIATNGTGELVYTFANKENFEDVGYGLNNIGSGNGKFDWDDLNENGQHDIGEISEPFSDTGLNPLRSEWKNASFGWQDGVYNMGNPVEEDVNTLLFRAVRWFVDKAKPDGFRLDAVKHAPFYFLVKQINRKMHLIGDIVVKFKNSSTFQGVIQIGAITEILYLVRIQVGMMPCSLESI